jgi:hypothetical protein
MLHDDASLLARAWSLSYQPYFVRTRRDSGGCALRYHNGDARFPPVRLLKGDGCPCSRELSPLLLQGAYEGAAYGPLKELHTVL